MAAAGAAVGGVKGSVFIVSALLLLLSTGGFCESQSTTNENREVKSLGGNSDFKSITLHWKYPKQDETTFEGFKITACEDQAWGPHRCRNQVLTTNELTQNTVRDDGTDDVVEYSGKVTHLRMATNYTIQVTPMVDTSIEGRSPGAKGRAIPDQQHTAQVLLQTKGFSARAVSCLTNSTLVEVSTGPHFGGKISVEGSTDEACAIQGDAKSSNSQYRLNIDHSVCGSKIMNDSVRTYVIVQENLPILTHSTRRFMVVCRYLPEAFTVSAGVSLPGGDEAGSPLIPVDQSINEVDPSELFDSFPPMLGSRSGRTGKALKLQSKDDDTTEASDSSAGVGSWAQLVLMVVMVVGAVTGLSCVFWHFGKHAGLTTAIRRGAGSATQTSSAETEPIEDCPDTVIVEDLLQEQNNSVRAMESRVESFSEDAGPSEGTVQSSVDTPVMNHAGASNNNCDTSLEVLSPTIFSVDKPENDLSVENNLGHWEKFDETVNVDDGSAKVGAVDNGTDVGGRPADEGEVSDETVSFGYIEV